MKLQRWAQAHARRACRPQQPPLPGPHVSHGPRCLALASSIGPQEPPQRRVRKPEWVRILEEDAENDEDVARLLEGTQGDPEVIRERMKRELQRSDMFTDGLGSEKPPRISFRQYDPFNLWVWFQFEGGPPSRRELDMLQTLLQSWFTIGKFGAFNSQNMQVFYNAGDDQSFFDYDNDAVAESQGSFLHDLTELEVQADWARCRLDLGTCDELAVDALLNCLVGFSLDVLGLKQVIVGGQNRDWPVPVTEDLDEDDEFKVDIDPMQLPEGLEEELEVLDSLQAEGMLTQRGGAPGGGSISGSRDTDASGGAAASSSGALSSRDVIVGARGGRSGGRGPGGIAGGGGGSTGAQQAGRKSVGRKALSEMDREELAEALARGEERLSLEGLEELLEERGGLGEAQPSTSGEGVPQRQWGDSFMKRYSEEEFSKAFKNK